MNIYISLLNFIDCNFVACNKNDVFKKLPFIEIFINFDTTSNIIYKFNNIKSAKYLYLNRRVYMFKNINKNKIHDIKHKE